MKVVIFGTGNFADLVCHYLIHDSDHDVVGFSVDRKYQDTNLHMGLPLVAYEDIEKHFPPSEFGLFVAVGYNDINRIREQKFEDAKSKGYRLITYVSSKAISLSKDIGCNCMIMEGAVLQPFVTLGDGVIVWPGSVISHHSSVAGFCYISPNVTVCGASSIGQRVFVGAGATIRNHVHIDDECVIAMGATVTDTTPQTGLYKGCPAEFSGKVGPGRKI